MGFGNRIWEWERGWDLGAGRASKDIAESPTAIAGTHTLISDAVM